jgi:F-type H+-transporting ATPase subunit delta
VSETATLTASVAGRYANALFELASEAGSLEDVERDVTALQEALGESADLRRLIDSPLYDRDEQSAAMAAVCDAMNLGELLKNLVGVMASKRRLFALADVLRTFRELLAEHRGEITAEVVSARPLSDAQRDALEKAIGRSTGRAVRLEASVDEDLIGGLVVRVGSRMIDTSVRSRLTALENAMKGVG